MATTNDSMEENVGEILVAWQKYKANGSDELDLREGDVVELLDTEDPSRSSKRIKLDPELDSLANKSSLLDNTAARHKLSVKPSRKHASSRYSPTRNNLNTRWLVKQINGKKAQGWVPCNVLQSSDEPTPGTGLPGDAAFRRQAVVKELVETENEFVKDLDFVVQEYLIRTEATKVPKVIKDNLELVFGGLVEIANFHRTVLMEGVKYYANEPNLLGKAFLRLERDFDKHVNYCTDEPTAQAFLESCDIAREYFDDLSQRLGDDKTLSEHLKLPIQRINDYQLLLKELVRYSECLEEDCVNLQKALELMLSVPHRAQDDKFTSNIEGYRGSIHKLGRLISHDWFSATFGNTTKERYLFLFKARILITKVRRISEDRSIFQLKDIIRLPQIEIKDHPNNRTFELIDKVGGHSLILASHRDFVKELWLKEIREFASDVEEQTEDLVLSEATSTLASEAVPPEFKAYVPPQATDAQKQLAAALQSGIKKVSEVPKTQVSKLSETNQNQIDENEKSTSYQTTNDQKGAQESETLQVLTNSERSETNEESLPRDGLNREVKPGPTGQSKPELKPEKEETKSTVEPSNRPLPNHVNQEETFKSTTKVTKEEAKVVETNRVVCIELNKEVNKTTSNESDSSSRSIEKTVRGETVSSKELLSKVKTEAAQLPSKPNQEDLIELPTVNSTKVEPKVLPQTVDSKPVVKDSLESLTTAVSKVEAQKVPEPLPDKVKVTSVEPEEQLLKPLPKKQEESQAVCQTLPTKEEKLPPNNKDIKETCILSKKSDNKENINVNLVQDKKAENIKVTPLEQSKTNLTDKSKNSDSKRKDPTTDSKQSNQPALKKSKGERETKLEETKQKVVEEKVVEVGEEPKKLEKGDKEVQKESDKKSTDGAASLKKSPEEIPKRKTQETQKLPDENSETEEKAPKKLRFAEAPREVETPNNQTLNSTSSENTQTQQNHSQPPKEEERREELRNFGERNPDEPPIPVPIPPPKPVKPHHNKIEVSVVETQIKGVNFGVQLSVEVDDEMSRRYSGKGGEDYDSSFSRRSIKRSSYGTDGLSSSRHESSISGKYGSESLSGKYGSDSIGSKYGTDALTSSKYSVESSLSSKYGAGDLSGSKYGESISLGRKSVTDTGNGESLTGSSYSRKYHSESLDSGDALGSSYSRKYGSDLGDAESYSYSRKSVSSLESGSLGDTSKYASKRGLGGDIDDVGISTKYTRKSYTSYNDDDDDLMGKYSKRSKDHLESVKRQVSSQDDEDLIGKYSKRSSKDHLESVKRQVSSQDDEDLIGKYSKRSSKDHLESVKRQVSSQDEDDLLSKFSKYERRISQTKKTVIEDDEALKIEEEMRRKYAPSVSVESKTSETSESLKAETQGKNESLEYKRSESKEYKRSESKEYKKSESKEYKRSESKEQTGIKTQESVEEEGSIKTKKTSRQNSESTKQKSDEERRDSGSSNVANSGDGSVATTFTLNRRKSSGVEGRPVFKRTISGTNVEPGESAVFEVELAVATDSLTWLKDNKPLKHLKRIKTSKTEDGVCRLEINESEARDAGLYSAIAVNSISKSTCSAQLIVHELTEQERAERLVNDKPVFLVQLKDTELLEDTYLRFMVKVKGDPTPKIAFFKDDVQIKDNDERYQIVRESSGKGFYELVIPEVQHEDAGKYKCVASNKFGEATSEATVTVTDFKNIFGDLADDELLHPGEKPVFYWKKDGNIFEPEERFKVLLGDDEDSLALVFQHVRPEDAGLYTCVAQTSSGHISCSAELTVHGVLNQLLREPEKPQLVAENKEACANVGNSGMLELQVKGYPKPQIKWTHDGTPIEPSSKYKFLYEEDEENYTLVIKNVEPNDAGTYIASAENELGSDTVEMYLNVKAGPKIKSNCEDISQEASTIIRIPVEVEGLPKPTVTFLKEGQTIKKNERIKIVEEGEKHTLIIENCNIKDSGSYSVVVANEISQTSKFWSMDIYSPPKITKKLGSNKTVSLKEDITLSVKIESKPDAEVTWYKDEQEVSGSHYITKKEEDSYSLKISGTVTTDSARYKVKAKNIHGSAEDECRVDVKIAPKITKPLVDKTVVEKEKNVEFDVKVEAFPKPTIKWYFDEMEITESRTEFTRIESDDGSKLVIKEVSSDLSGKYKCKVVNELGETETSAKLTVNCKPRFIKHLKDTTIEEGATLHLEVEVDACPEPTVKWLRNGREVTTDARIKITRDSKRYEAYHLAVDLIKYEEQGDYEVVVTNSLGTVSSKSVVTVQKIIHTDAIEETEPPEEVVIEDNSNKGVSMEKYSVEIKEITTEPIVEEPFSPEELLRAQIYQKEEIGVVTTEQSQHPTEEYLAKKRVSGVKSVSFDTTVIVEVEEVAQGVVTSELSNKAQRTKSMQEEESEMLGRDDESQKFAEETSSEIEPQNATSGQVEGAELNKSSLDEPTHYIVEDEGRVKPKKSKLAQLETAVSVDDEDSIPKTPVEHDVAIKTLNRAISAQKEDAEVIEANKEQFEPQFQNEEDFRKDKLKRAKSIQMETIDVNENEITSPTEISVTDTVVKKKPERAISVREEEIDLVEIKPSVQVVEDEEMGGDKGVSEIEDENEKKANESDNGFEAPPKILESNLNDKSQYESLDVAYVVKATSNPIPTAVWSVDGKPLTQDNRVKISDNGEEFKLEIKKLNKKDAGVIECKVSNLVGEAKTQAKLSIIPEGELRKPKIKDGLTDKTALKHKGAKLSAVIEGEPVPDATWYINNKEITPEQFEKYKIILDADDHDIENDIKECTFALSIPHSHQENTGKYKIKAKNKWGECESSAQLTIVYLPEIEGPKDIHVVPGESAEFSAKVIANPQAKISWMKDGKPLEKRSGVNIIDDNKNGVYKVTFDNVELADEGKYQVVAKNEIGETTSDTKLKAIKETGPTPEKPQFITGLADAEVEDGGEITVMVRADGIPKPEIRWFFNGKSLEEDAKHKIVSKSEAQITSTLSVLDYNKNDIGQYKAMAVNVVGEAETTSQILMVQRAPTFGKMLERAQEINEGEPLKLIVKVSGSPKPTVTWLKNGEPITGENVEITMLPDGTAKLYIDKVLPSDSGAYKVLIKNPNGETSSMCAVAVTPKPQRPKFLKCIKDVKAPEEQQIRLQAQVVGYPVPDIKWQKDGVTIRPSSSIHVEQHPDGTVALIVDSAKPENAGTYTLIATNKLGESENDAQVVIEKKSTKPEFITKLQPLTAVEGFPAKLEVKAKGFPAPQITWTRNGVEIVPDNQHIKIMDLPDGTSALFIDACDIRRDPMSYKAIATNEAGDTESSAILAVSPATKEGEPEEAPMFLHSMRDVVADEDQPLVIDVPFVGNPIPRVEWFKDEEPLEPSDRVLLTCDGKKVALQIDNCTPADAGKYGVKLTNALGSDASEGKATVHKVFSPPRFTQKFTDLQQLPGRDAKFSGKVSGVPTPEITWYKDGTAIKPNEKYRMKTDGDLCSLYINNCQASDAGLYRAFAVNKEGSDTCEAQFNTVDEITTPLKAEPPSFLKKIGDMDLYKGMTAKFTACITGFPEPKVEWFKNDKQLKPSSRIKMEVDQAGLLRLTVAKIDEDDLGKYSCKITNEHGSDICHATLQFDDIDARPRKPISDEYIEFDKHQKSGIPVPLSDPPIVSRMTDRHCTLSWKPSVPSYARPPVTYQLEMCELPHGDWFTARSGIRNCVCTVGNLEPFRDYRFRIRIENKYGISDPSPYATTYRQKLEPDPPRFNTHLPIGIPFHPDTSPYFPHDFDIERPLHDNMSQSPRFLRQEHPTQYGMKNQNTNLFWYVYGYPKPKMEYYFNDEPIPSGGRFDTSYTRNGQATLFINKMLDRDVGWYEAVATNEHGIARQRVRLEIAELPEFTKRPDIEYSMVRGKVRFEARISGRPYPDIKWYKDWKPVAESSRIKIRFIEPDLCILTIDDIILKDSGLYSVSARNAAGTISSSAMLYVDENDYQYKLHTYSPISTIRSKRKLYDEFYDFGDELGRGTQGITYHAVDRSNGYNYAAKVMHGRGDVRPFMYNELDMYNQLRHRRLVSLYDAYDSEDCLVFILELGGGGELVRDYLIRRDYYTETDIAGYIRQTLQGLQYMHEQGYGHMGLNIGDILLTHPGSSEIKITDFGLSRRITPGNLYPLLYGVPEYVCPEAVLGEGTGYGQDMWSIGIITYILLSGRSPFLGENDRETLYRIKDGTWTFDMDWWCNISVEARDFISKLLIYKPGDRMDVRAALRHPWLERIDRIYRDEYQISSRYLNDYYMLYRDWYNNASCRQWFRRRPLDGAYTHPSKMVYPPGEIYTPPPSPTPQRKHYSPIRTWEDQLPSRSPLNYEIGLIKSESHYQNGPDTYLLQLRDVSFPVRVREYMKVAANRGPGRSLVVSNENGFDWDTPVVRERRRFTDVMDEEIDDERKARINKYGVDNVASYSIRRLRRELGPRLDTYAEAEAMIESRQDGRLPFFREKPQITAMVEGKELDLTCFVVGDPSPTVQWFKNDAMVVESARVSIETDSEGRTHFKLLPALSFDVGMYRVVARNKIGQTVAWTRIVYGTVPDAPDSPTASQVSDTEILLTWKPPKYDGNSPVLCYSLQYKAADTTDWEWIQKVDNIDHEFYLISGLEPNKRYLFRLAANSAVGWSEQGVPSAVITTLTPDAPKIELSAAMRHLQQITDSGKPVEPEVKLRPDYSLESKPVDWQEGNPNDNYEYISEISRGQYSAVLKAVDRKSNKLVVAKLLDLSTETCDNVDGEFAALRSLRHERIAGLLEAYRTSTDVATFIMEKLQGADVLTYLASKHEYTEDMVATIVSQISDGLQYLHWRNLCHLDIQPDNVVMCGLRAVQIKLVDFGCAHRVTKLGTKVPMVGHPDYISPEVLNEEPAFPQSDIWSLGVLTYVMLSGALPFQGEDVNEIRQNISFVRYRFEYLYQELSQEGNRFIMMIFKRNPHKRPTAEECHENRWLLPTDSMIKKRDRAVFLGSRLREYCEKYHSEKSKQTTSSKVGRSLVKSHSIQEELLIAP